MEKPVITYDNQGCSDIVVNGKTGWVCTDKTLHGLIEATSLFLRMNFEKRMEMGKLGRSYVKNKFDVRGIVETYAEKLEEYLGPRDLVLGASSSTELDFSPQDYPGGSEHDLSTRDGQ